MSRRCGEGKQKRKNEEGGCGGERAARGRNLEKSVKKNERMELHGREGGARKRKRKRDAPAIYI